MAIPYLSVLFCTRLNRTLAATAKWLTRKRPHLLRLHLLRQYRISLNFCLTTDVTPSIAANILEDLSVKS